MPVTDHSTVMQLWLKIDLDLIHIYITIPLGCRIGVHQVDTGRNLFTVFSVNTFMHKYNGQYGKVFIRLNVLDTIFFQIFDDW